MSRWFGEQLRVDVIDETLRRSGDLLHGALAVTTLDDAAAWRDADTLRWAGDLAEFFHRAVHAFLAQR